MKRILVLLLIGVILFGCVAEDQPADTVSNQTNISNESVTPPEISCSGPVCGSDGNTYETDCEAMDSGIDSYYLGECPTEPECIETDGGVDLKTKGSVTKAEETYDDNCIDESQLVEYTCIDNNIDMATFICGENEQCADGQCVDIEIPEEARGPIQCTGPVKWNISISETASFNGTTYNDTCVDFTTVKDFYCRDNELKNINNECPPGQGCINGECVVLPFECTETDDGRDIFYRGRVVRTRGLKTTMDMWDECIDDGLLLEHYCLENDSVISEEIECGSGFKCAMGRCIESDCSETDDGLDIYSAGITSDEDEDHEDKCLDDHNIREYYCYGEYIESKDKNCGEGYVCDDGECIED